MARVGCGPELVPVIPPEKWANLRGGEVFTAPACVDGVLGDYLCARYGDLEETPLTVTIERSRLVDAKCARREIADDLRASRGRAARRRSLVHEARGPADVE